MQLTPEQKHLFNQTLLPLLQHEKIKEMSNYMQHGDTSCYSHSLAVTYTSYLISLRLHMDVDHKSLIRGAMLHDFFLYDWHDASNHKRFHGFHHPRASFDNASTYFDLTLIEKDIILHHMWPLTPMPPRTKEAYIVTLADKWCSIKETIRRPSIRHLMASSQMFINNLLD